MYKSFITLSLLLLPGMILANSLALDNRYNANPLTVHITFAPSLLSSICKEATYTLQPNAKETHSLGACTVQSLEISSNDKHLVVPVGKLVDGIVYGKDLSVYSQSGTIFGKLQ